MNIETDLESFGSQNSTLYLEAFDKHSVKFLKKLDKLINKHLKEFATTDQSCYNSNLD